MPESTQYNCWMIDDGFISTQKNPNTKKSVCTLLCFLSLIGVFNSHNRIFCTFFFNLKDVHLLLHYLSDLEKKTVNSRAHSNSHYPHYLYRVKEKKSGTH